MFAGKDTVIDKLHLEKFALADPVYTLVQTLYGTSDKSAPGIRGELQRLYRWGNGCMTTNDTVEEHDDTVRYMQHHGKSIMHPQWDWVNWSDYGQPGFWLSILQQRLAREQKLGLKECAVSSIRWPDELQWVFNNGYTHVHVACSKQTRDLRMAAMGYKPQERETEDASEVLSRELDSTNWHMHVPKTGVMVHVWNDTCAVPNSEYLTVDQFVEKFRE